MCRLPQTLVACAQASPLTAAEKRDGAPATKISQLNARAPGRGRRGRPSPASRLLQLGGIFLVLALPVLAHPIHRSVAEAKYQPETHTLQIAVRVFADDFEDALSNHAKQKLSIEKSAADELDRHIRDYLAARFKIKSPDGAVAVHRWIGRELKGAENELWLYFEASLPGGVEGARFHHALLSEHFRDQLNSVLVRDGTRKVTLVFLPNHGEKTVRFRP